MTKYLHSLRQLFNGTRPTDDKVKFRILGFSIAFVHFTFTIFFLRLNINPLAIYNAVVTIFYIYLGIIVGKNDNYTAVFVSAFIEILFHSILASLLVGWGLGFMHYTISLIPLAFYLTYTLPYFEKSIVVPTLIGVILWICYMVVHTVTEHIEPYYVLSVPQRVIDFFYYYNCSLAFMLQIFASILFAIEIRFMQMNLEQENIKLGEIANYDPLTHLMNRRSMKPYLEQAVRSQESFCVIMADIDNFKRVNDTHGHAMGDEVLIAVADVIRKAVREGDSVCRWGGEEILVLLKTRKETAVQVADRICRDISRTNVFYGNLNISVTVTLGVAQSHLGDTYQNVIERADEKLYYGKNHGKNQVVA